MGFRDYNGGIKGVCYGCEERYPACHDTCEKYKEARAEYDQRKETILKEKNKDREHDTYKLHSVRKAKKEGRNHGKNYWN